MSNNFITDVLPRNSSGVPASGVITFGAPTPVTGATVIIGGFSFVFGTDFNGGDQFACASSLATLINRGIAPSALGTLTTVYPFFAFAVGANVWIVNRQEGVIGNAVAISTTGDTGTKITVPATLTGGVDRITGKNAVIGATTIPAVTASAYTAGNVFGGLLTFAAAVGARGTGVLQSLTVLLKEVQATGLKLTLFNANPTASTFTDKAALSVNAADVTKIIGTYSLTADSTAGTMTGYFLNAIGKVVAPGANAAIYGVLSVVSTPTPGSTTALLDVRIGVAQD